MNKTDDKAIRPFDQILREISGGRLVDELTNELTEVIAAVQATGKAGKISLTLSLSPRGECNDQVDVKPSVKGIKPERERPYSIFFINRDHGLQRDDPTQHSLPGIRSADEDPRATGTNDK